MTLSVGCRRPVTRNFGGRLTYRAGIPSGIRDFGCLNKYTLEWASFFLIFFMSKDLRRSFTVASVAEESLDGTAADVRAQDAFQIAEYALKVVAGLGVQYCEQNLIFNLEG